MPPARHRWGAYNQGLRCLQPRRPSSPLTGSRGDGKGLVRAIVDLNWLTCNTTIPRPHSSDLQPLPPAARRQGSWGGATATCAANQLLAAQLSQGCGGKWSITITHRPRTGRVVNKQWQTRDGDEWWLSGQAGKMPSR